MSNQITPSKRETKSDSDIEDSQTRKREYNLPDGFTESLTEEARSSAEAPDLDEIFGLLKNYRRRCVLRYLSTVNSSVSLSDLAEQVSGWENDKEPRLITSSERKRVYVGLYQSHLPKMDDRDAISFNKPRGIVEKGRYFHHFQHYLPARDDSNESVVNGFIGRVSRIIR